MPTPTGAAEQEQAVREAAFLGHEEVARDTLAFRFAKPQGFEHVAGQFVILRLPEGLGLEGEDREHMFSLASAPQDAELRIATRMRGGPWKEALRRSEPGTPIEVDGPDGDFTLHEDASRPAVFLAGGIASRPSARCCATSRRGARSAR
jgi:ferredoxin-NADP reductase